MEWHTNQEVLSRFDGINAGGMIVFHTIFKALPHEFRLMIETMSGTNSPVSSFNLPTRRHPVGLALKATREIIQIGAHSRQHEIAQVACYWPETKRAEEQHSWGGATDSRYVMGPEGGLFLGYFREVN